MKRTGTFYTCFCMLAACMLVLSIWGCKGSSGGSSGQVADTEGSGYGKVGILLTDGPADNYDHIWITVTEVSLLPSCDSDDNDAVILFSSEEGYRFDLLQYRDTDFLLKLNEAVPVGKYEKVRLRVVKVEAEGGDDCPCEEMEIKVPGGKIDLNPRGGVVVTENSTLYIRLDIDANKSINLHEAGHSGKCIFRPVVFVDILAKASFPTCPIFIRGNVTALTDSDSDGYPEYLTLSRDHTCMGMGSIRVRIDEDTAVFKKDGMFGTPADVMVGDQVMVRGMVDDGYFAADLIVVGEALSLKGTVEGPVSTDGLFDFTPDAGQEVNGTITVSLAGATPVLTGCDEPFLRSALIAGMQAKVIGRYDAEAEKFYAAIVLVQPKEIKGVIISVLSLDQGFTFTILTNEGAVEVVTVQESFTIFIEGDGLLESEAVSVLNLVGCSIRIVEGSALTEVILTPENLEGEVQGISFDTRSLLVSGTWVHVMPLATGIDIVGEEYSLIPFTDIMIGDPITCFGFSSSGGEFGFHAFAYLVGDED